MDIDARPIRIGASSNFPLGAGILGVTWSADGSSIVIGLEEPKSDIVLLYAD